MVNIMTPLRLAASAWCRRSVRRWRSHPAASRHRPIPVRAEPGSLRRGCRAPQVRGRRRRRESRGRGHPARRVSGRFPVGRVGLEPLYGLGLVVHRDVVDIVVAEGRGHRHHHRVVASAGAEQAQLLGQVHRALTGKTRPGGVGAVAVRAVAGGAHGRLGGAGLRLAVRERVKWRGRCCGAVGAAAAACALFAAVGAGAVCAAVRAGVEQNTADARVRRLGAATLFLFRSVTGAQDCTLRPSGFLLLENMSRFNDVRFLVSAAADAQFPADMAPRWLSPAAPTPASPAPSTRSRSGQGLAHISKTPGRTRLLNFFELLPTRRLVDLPGYGYAKGPAAERRVEPLIDALRARASLKGLFMIVDTRRGFTMPTWVCRLGRHAARRARAARQGRQAQPGREHRGATRGLAAPGWSGHGAAVSALQAASG